MSIEARVAARTLGIIGWRYAGEPPTVPKFVGLATPHTSNMDAFLMLLLTRQIGLEISWMVKDAVDKPVLGSAVRRYGAVFIDRSRHHGVVDQMVEEFARRETFHLLIPPEGTRGYADYWKSGFYHIALGARVPVVPGFLDYRRRIGGFGDPIELTGDVRVDMDAIRAFYAAGQYAGRYPEKVGRIRLREEDEG